MTTCFSRCNPLVKPGNDFCVCLLSLNHVSYRVLQCCEENMECSISFFFLKIVDKINSVYWNCLLVKIYFNALNFDTRFTCIYEASIVLSFATRFFPGQEFCVFSYLAALLPNNGLVCTCM